MFGSENYQITLKQDIGSMDLGNMWSILKLGKKQQTKSVIDITSPYPQTLFPAFFSLICQGL